jgi:hypothetical protein
MKQDQATRWVKRKKKLQKRRSNKKLLMTNSRLIADTNVWYLLGRDNEIFEKVKNKRICPNYINIVELSNTGNLVRKEESTRNAIRKMFHFQENAIFEPPFVHVAQLVNEYDFDIQDIHSILEFTSIFAQGDKIDDKKNEAFFMYIKEHNKGFEDAVAFLNEEAQKIRLRIIDKKKHGKVDSIQSTAGFINFCVEISTNKKCNIDGINLKQIELLVLTMDRFFKTMELSKMNMKPNDWFDLALLSYVRPGDKLWTNDGRLIQMIKEAGCEKYLYKM